MPNISFPSLKDWVCYIETLSTHIINFNLKNIRKVAQQLNLLDWSIPVITITGTNGKGTCAVAIEKIYFSAGYQTGLFNSPYLISDTEQIRLNGVNIDETRLCRIFETIEQNRHDIQLTLFEFTTLASLLFFKQHGVDVIILEVGMGGLHDAVNIVAPNLVIVTNIAMDHIKYLGDTREKIAMEKFGLVRLKTPVIYADYKPIPKNALNQLRIKKARLYELGKDFHCPVNLPIALSKTSIAAAIKAIEILQHLLPVKKQYIQQGLSKTSLSGRFQIIKHPIMQIFDVAHNPSSALLLAEKLNTQGKYNQTIAIFSILGDKDITGTIRPLVDIVSVWHISVLNHPRAATMNQLNDAFQALNVKRVYQHSSLKKAYHTVLNASHAHDRIIIFGSFKLNFLQ